MPAVAKLAVLSWRNTREGVKKNSARIGAVWIGGIPTPRKSIKKHITPSFARSAERSLRVMETTVVNTAAERVTLSPAEQNPYDPTSLMLYHTSVGLVEKLVKQGLLTPSDYKKAIDVLNKKYGLSSCSIFAEIA